MKEEPEEDAVPKVQANLLAKLELHLKVEHHNVFTDSLVIVFYNYTWVTRKI